MSKTPPAFEVAPDGTAFEISGRPDAPVVVLIHGLGLCRHMWKEHRRQLEGHFRVVSYDLYGHGDSSPRQGALSLSTYARQIVDLLDHLETAKAFIVGFSIGGMINRRLVMDVPERVWGLVIANSPHDRGVEAQNKVEQRALDAREQGPMATFDEAVLRWFTSEYVKNGARVSAVKQWRQNVDPESYAAAAWVLANGVRELVEHVGQLEVPALVVTCENDVGSTPQMSMRIAKEIDQAELLIIPGLKHLGIIEKPGLFTDPIMEFLLRFR